MNNPLFNFHTKFSFIKSGGNMKSIDVKSVIIGMLSMVIIFMTVGMRQTVTNMGDIGVTSITVIGEDDEKALFIGSGGGGNGYLKTYNKYGKTSAYLGTGGGGTGGFKIYNRDGKTLAFISGSKEGRGFLEISNSNGDAAAKLLADDNDSGQLRLNDADGNMAFDSDNAMTGDASLGDVTVNSLSVIDAEDALKVYLGVDDEKNGYLRVTHEIEDYYYPSDEPEIELDTFGDISVKSITITDSDNNTRAFLGLDDSQNGQLKLSDTETETVYPLTEAEPELDFGDIRVSSLTVVNENQSAIGYFGPSDEGKGNIRTLDMEGSVLFSSDETSKVEGNLGNIRVNSITVQDGAENEVIYLGTDEALNGLISVANADGDVTFTTSDPAKESKEKNLGDITVNSITVMNEYFTPTTFIGNTPEGSGRLEVNDFTGNSIFNSDQAVQTGEEFGEIQVRSLEIVNQNQETMMTLGTAQGQFGVMKARDSAGNVIFSSDEIPKGGDGQITGDDIVVNSITLKNENDEITGFLGNSEDGNSELRIYGTDESETVLLGTNFSGHGFMRTYNTDGTQTLYMGTSESGDGLLKTYSSEGKKTTYLGSNKNNTGMLNTYNDFGDMAAMIGTSSNNSGTTKMFDSNGGLIFSVNDTSGNTTTKNLTAKSVTVVDGSGAGKGFIGVNNFGKGFISTNNVYTDTIRSEYGNTTKIQANQVAVKNDYGEERIFLGVNQEDIGFIKTNLSNTDIDFLSTESAKNTEVLGDIQVSSLSITTPEGDTRVFLGRNKEGNGIITTHNEIGAQTNFLGSDIDGSGKLQISNTTGQKIATIGTGVNDGGSLTTYNRMNEITASLGVSEDGVTGHLTGIDHVETFNQIGFKTAYFGNGSSDEGLLRVFNAEGVQSMLMGTLSTGGGIITSNTKGLITSFLGTSGSDGGHLITYNSYGKKTSFMGTNKHNDGMVILRDKGGNIGWGKDGRIPAYYAKQ